MTKQELIKQIARETGVEATTVSAVVEGFMEAARNITKNTTLKIPAHDIPAFKASPEFLRLLK